jgi:hypothetical protein
MTGYLHGSLDEARVLQILEQIETQLGLNGRGGGTNGQATNERTPKGFVLFVHSNNGAFVYASVPHCSNNETKRRWPFLLRIHELQAISDLIPFSIFHSLFSLLCVVVSVS